MRRIIYLYTCEHCNNEEEVKIPKDIHKCPICGKKLCDECSTFEFCSEHFKTLKRDVKLEIIEVEKEWNNKKKNVLILLYSIIIMDVLAILFSFINGKPETDYFVYNLISFPVKMIISTLIPKNEILQIMIRNILDDYQISNKK